MNAPIERMREALGILAAPCQVVEIRVPGGGPYKTRSGYFDDLDLAARAAAQLNGKESVYATLNPCAPALLARAPKNSIDYVKTTTSDRDIARRAWFPIDLDPVRPAGVSSTDIEHEAAIARARDVYAYLHSAGWPEPIRADSGNGAHLIYRIDLPNDSVIRDLIKQCLQVLALRYGDERVAVDQSVFNAARIWKVYGTFSRKGENTRDRPHRQAKLLAVPDTLGYVTVEQLRGLAENVPKPSPPDPHYARGERFDIDGWISAHCPDAIGPTEWNGGRKWIYPVCPWDAAHTNRSAYIVQFSNGAIAAGCHHNSCSGNDWMTLREKYEPGYRDKSSNYTNQEEPEPAQAESNGNSYPSIPPLKELQITETEDSTARLTPDCIVEDYLHCDVSLLAGSGGAGKTTLLLCEATHIALGLPLYGLEVRKRGRVLLVTAEDRREMLVARFRRVRDGMRLSDEQHRTALKSVLIWDVTGKLCRLAEQDNDNNVVITGLADAIVDAFRDDPPVMVVFDPCISFGAGERLVNDNEQALILAARRIVRSLGCCVRLIHHTGKANARAKTLDQYSARGGSALSDGARMVTVLQPWGEDDDPDRPLPYGFTLAKDQNAFILARAKNSYCRPGPLIWIKRRGFAFEHHIEIKQGKEDLRAALASQLECFLVDQLKQNRRHTQNSLFDADLGGSMKNKQIRAAISDLTVAGRITRRPLPPDDPRRGPKGGVATDYIHPVCVAVSCVSPSDIPDEKTPKNRRRNVEAVSPSAGVSAYRENNVDTPDCQHVSPISPRCVKTALTQLDTPDTPADLSPDREDGGGTVEGAV